MKQDGDQDALALVLERGKDAEPVCFSYKILSDNVSRLKRYFQPNSRIAVSLPICVESIFLFLAITEAGSTFVPLNPELTQSECKHLFSQAEEGHVKIDLLISNTDISKVFEIPFLLVSLYGTNVTLSQENILPKFGEIIAASPENIALILFTSGTTAAPKAVPLTHLNLLASIDNILATIPVTRSDITLNVMPLFHIHGLVASVLTSLCAGATVVVPSTGKFSASRFWPTIQSFQCTWFTVVPTIHQILLPLCSPAAIRSLRFVRSSSSRLDPAVLEEMEEKYNCTVIEAYAMTETAYQITSNPFSGGSAKRKPGTVGFPHGSVEIMICDSNGREKISGEICVRGPNVIRHYLNNPEADSAAFFPNGYFRTGDLGFIDPQDGFLAITGRLKEQINRGGEKISPMEIEQVARMHANISDAVAFAIPDLKYGEVIGLAIVMKKAEDAISEEEMREFLKIRLATFKIPSRIWIADSPFPRTSGTGKLQRSLLASHFIETISHPLKSL